MIEKEELYPLVFEPIYKEVVWGGSMLKTHLKRTLPKSDVPIGESWEISDREGSESVISNGELKGWSIRKLLQKYEKAIVGESYRGGRFPLLVKLIDAGKRLSLQVHPDEHAARAIPGAEPKTEMWYVVAAKPSAKIFAGLKSNCTQSQFLASINSTEIETFLQAFPATPGDAYFINAGRVHAIGAGTLLLEIQQNSNTTFRISDWGRLGADGKPRELHVEEAIRSINFMDRKTPRIAGVSSPADYNRKFPIINRCPYFRVDELRIVETYLDRTDRNSFHILSAINGNITVNSLAHDNPVKIKRGSSCLVPSIYGQYSISIAEEGEETIVIKTTL